MLTLGFEDELTEEEELVNHSFPSTASATQGIRHTALCLLMAHMLSMDAPRDVQKLELESVKRERRTLMDSLAALKADQGSAGNERQMADITRLRHELKSKQEKVNELKQARGCPLFNVKHANACIMHECAVQLLCSAWSLQPAYQYTAGREKQVTHMCCAIGSLHGLEVACAPGSDEQPLCSPHARHSCSCRGAHEAIPDRREVRWYQQLPLQQCTEHASCGRRKLQMQRGSWSAWPSQAKIAQR